LKKLVPLTENVSEIKLCEVCNEQKATVDAKIILHLFKDIDKVIYEIIVDDLVSKSRVFSLEHDMISIFNILGDNVTVEPLFWFIHLCNSCLEVLKNRVSEKEGQRNAFLVDCTCNEVADRNYILQALRN